MWKVALTVLAAVLAVGYGAMVGGFRDADINDEGVQNALHFAVVQHNRGSNDLYLSQVAEVIKVQSQVSRWPLYTIYLLYAFLMALVRPPNMAGFLICHVNILSSSQPSASSRSAMFCVFVLRQPLARLNRRAVWV
uniref:Cystatin domain-containing protein n=1 Tax=Oreochromis aureus TaxID=47969 RepID=A0AAZ1X116_OREAU